MVGGTWARCQLALNNVGCIIGTNLLQITSTSIAVEVTPLGVYFVLDEGSLDVVAGSVEFSSVEG